MARTKGPLMSLDASGSIAKTITFSKWKGRSYVRELVIPANPKSGGQVGVRSTFKFITQIFGTLSALIVSHWKDIADQSSVTPLNSMVSRNQSDFSAGFGLIQDPTFTPGAVEAAPGGGAAAAAIRQLIVTWVDSGGADDWCTLIYASTVNGFTPSTANLVAVIPNGVQLFTHKGLSTGVAEYYRIGGCETGGTLGTLAAQFTGTPL